MADLASLEDGVLVVLDVFVLGIVAPLVLLLLAASDDLLARDLGGAFGLAGYKK